MKMTLVRCSWFIAAVLAAVPLCQAAEPFDWPQWRGPSRSDISKESGLLQDWPEGGPQQVWLYKNAGQGYAGPAIVAGKLFTMGTREGAECLLALNSETGSELWAAKMGEVLENNWGDGPRGTPTVDGEHVYALSGSGNLVCARTGDGSVVWQKKMADFGGSIPDWGYTESPLIEGNSVICTPGGKKGALVALDKKSGNLRWQSAEFTDVAQYASIVPADLNGTRQLIQLTGKSVVGISANDGQLLWRSPWPGKVAVIPTPIYRDNHVYVTSGYGVGCKLIKVDRDNKPSDVYVNKVMKNHHGGVVLVRDYLYGHSDPNGWVCQNFKTGEEVWVDKKFGKGAIAYADNRLYCLEEKSGTVALVEASPKGWTEHGRLTLNPQTNIRKPEGRIWTHPVISNGRLYLRDQDLIYCYAIKR